MRAQKALWLLNHYALAPDMPGGTRHFDLGREMVKRGYDVTILASSFHHAQRQEMRLLGTDAAWKVEEVEGVRFVWLRTFPYRDNDWRRLVNMIDYKVRSYWLGRRLPQLGEQIPEPDVIIGSSVHLLAVLSAYLLARHFGACFVMEVRDLWPQTLVDMGLLGERHLLTWLLGGLERFLYRRAQRIIVLLPKAREYIGSLGIDTSKVHWIPNGVNLSRFPMQETRGLVGDRFTVMYTGAHGLANGLDTVLDAAALLQQEGWGGRIRFRLVGDGPEKPRLQQRSRDEGIEIVDFDEAVPKSQIHCLLQEADALLMVLRDSAVFRWGVSPNKLFDYLASVRPVIFGVSSPFNPIVEADAGLAIPPEDARGMAGAIKRLAALPAAERWEMALRGRRYVEKHHDLARLADELERMLHELRGEGCAPGRP